MKINLTQTVKYPTLNNHIFDESIFAISEALRLAGHDTSITENTILPDRLNIIWGIGTHVSHSISELGAFVSPKNCIVFNMEQLASGSPIVTTEYLNFISKYVVWDYNANNVSHLQRSASPAPFASEFPLAPNRKLAQNWHSAGHTEFDVAFYGALVPHRVDTLNRITRTGIKVKLITNDFGDKLSKQLRDCALVLNIHAYPNTGIFEAPRCLRPISCGIPVVSEISQLPTHINWACGGVCFCENDAIPAKIQSLLNDVQAYTSLQTDALTLADSKDHRSICAEILEDSVRILSKI